jgi:SAM-dependent methyltransferase
MVYYGLAHNRDFAHEHFAFFQDMLEYVGDVEGLRLLDVGCGKSFWLTLLLASAGAKVTGIDTEVVKSGSSIAKYLDMLRKNGAERSIRTFVWEQIFARPYYRELEKLSPYPLAFDRVDLQAMSGSDLTFPDNSFDLVVSHEVFEHIADIPATLNGLFRVMKPEGRTYIYIHNYTSLSGGHHIAWKYPDKEPSRKVPPWDHLREHRYPAIPSWLNQLRDRDYRAEFEKRFEILDWFPTAKEGKHLLTDDIRSELSEYSEDELLTKGFVVVARAMK